MLSRLQKLDTAIEGRVESQAGVNEHDSLDLVDVFHVQATYSHRHRLRDAEYDRLGDGDQDRRTWLDHTRHLHRSRDFDCLQHSDADDVCDRDERSHRVPHVDHSDDRHPHGLPHDDDPPLSSHPPRLLPRGLRVADRFFIHNDTNRGSIAMVSHY